MLNVLKMALSCFVKDSNSELYIYNIKGAVCKKSWFLNLTLNCSCSDVLDYGLGRVRPDYLQHTVPSELNLSLSFKMLN